MPATPPKVFFDANVLVSAALSKDGPAYGLIHLTQVGILAGYTSTQVVEEARAAIQAFAPEAGLDLRRILGRARLRVRPTPRLRPEYEGLSHPKDCHVVAAAIRCKARYLATFNTRDFRGRLLRDGHGIMVIPPVTLLRLLGHPGL